MSDSLQDLSVLIVDCQAGGATPAYGDLLELGWAVCGASGLVTPARAHWIARRTDRPVPRAVRELTGWSEAVSSDAWPEQDAWRALRADALPCAMPTRETGLPTVIHFARFELGFLRELHTRLEGEASFPLDVVCLHAIAVRLYPELPRRNIRALAGFLGHSAELVRRAQGHVEASAFVWRALLPALAEVGVQTWAELQQWLAAPPATPRTKRKGRVYPFGSEQRRLLPDRPGVYRLLRKNGDVLYVGKATSIKKRIAGHFARGGKPTERALEMLTQVHSVAVTQTESALEAALLETDEIKRQNPPYNLQLTAAERRAWFASLDMEHALPAPDGSHRIGPLPSEHALFPFAALCALATGAEASSRLRAAALAVPAMWGPEPALFAEGWSAFVAEHLAASDSRNSRRALQQASLIAWRLRRREEIEATAEDAPPDAWDLARVRRRLDRSLVQGGLLMRRARWLTLLGSAEIAFRERDMPQARCLVLARAQIVEQKPLEALNTLFALPARALDSQRARQLAFDAADYDRMRIVATELQRVLQEGGEVALRIGKHALSGPRLVTLMRAV